MGRAFEYRKAAKMKRWGHMSRVFPKLGKLITIAAKEGGPDPDMNPKLRQAILNAKAENMPKDNIDAAIKRATDKDAANLVEVTYEGKGPFGIQCMVVCPGMIRTNFFDGTSLKRTAKTLDVYEGSAAHAALDYCLSHNYRQHGDPVKVAQLVYDVTMSEKMPLWLPVGKEAMKKLKAKCERMIEETAPYYEASCDTSYPRPQKK